MEEKPIGKTGTFFMWIFSIVLGAIFAYGGLVAFNAYKTGNVRRATLIFAIALIFWWISMSLGRKMIRALIIQRYVKSKKKKGGG